MITTATQKELNQALNLTNKQYKNNVDFVHIRPVSKTRLSFRLRVKKSHGPGGKIGFSGRHTIAACYHLHRDFMINLFNLNPTAKIISCQARYDGKDDFNVKYPSIGSKNVGSMMQPVCFADSCECGQH
jgi:hypothetical protein